jgi:phosphohistidine phosphatase
MKTLFILRHAKSSWDDPSLSDFERPLNERGKRAAPFMGKFMSDKGLEPSVILSSPAERAKQTTFLVKEASGFSSGLQFDERIYEASPQNLLQVASETDDAHGSAMLVGHNPGIEGFIRLLTGHLEPMPTAALAVIDLNIDKWSEIGDGCGELRDTYRPKDLIRL